MSKLTSAISAQKGFTGKLSGLASKYGSYADRLNDTSINNLLKYGEVSENDYVGQAVTDNTLAYDKARNAAARNLSRMGINPNSGRFAGMETDYAIKRAAAEAGARNKARISARNENFSRAVTLAGLGGKYDSMQGSMLNSAAANARDYISSTASLYNLNKKEDYLNDIQDRYNAISYK